MDVACLRPRFASAIVLGLSGATFAGCALFGPTTAMSFVRQIEQSPDPNLRYKAYQNLASPRCYDDDGQKTKAVHAMLARLDPEKEPPATRIVICRTLGAIGDPAARPALIRLVRDPDPLLRGEACRALGKVGVSQDATILMQAMMLDTDPNCQVAAIEGLGDLRSKDPRRVSTLVKALEHEDPAIRYASVQSLRKITGKDLGVEVGPWKALVAEAEKTADPATAKAAATAPSKK